MPDVIDDARRLIEIRLAELEAEAGELRRALESLGEASRPSPRRGGRPRPRSAAPAPAKSGHRAARRPKLAKRAPRGRRREELLAALKAQPGARPSEIARTMGVRSTQVSALIAKARVDKLIVKSGDGYALKP